MCITRAHASIRAHTHSLNPHPDTETHPDTPRHTQTRTQTHTDTHMRASSRRFRCQGKPQKVDHGAEEGGGAGVGRHGVKARQNGSRGEKQILYNTNVDIIYE